MSRKRKWARFLKRLRKILRVILDLDLLPDETEEIEK